MDQLSIANQALLSISARVQISSLNPSDGSAEANAVSVLWEPTYTSLARAAYWNCFTAQVTLSLVAAASGTAENPTGTDYITPPTPWTYAYALPSDSLAIRYIIPSASSSGSSIPQTSINNSAGLWMPNGNQIPFVVATMLDQNNQRIQVILTNQSQAETVYTANLNNPTYWDTMFQSAMVASLAAYLVPALSLSIPLMQICIKQADDIITQARVRDGNEGVTVMDHVPDWFIARSGGSGVGISYFTSGYIPMNWPGY